MDWIGRIEELQAENIALAAWQCPYTDGKEGLVCDEYGHQFCAKNKRIAQLKAREQSIKELLNDYSPVILSDGSAITKVGKQYVPASFYEKMQALLENQE